MRRVPCRRAEDVTSFREPFALDVWPFLVTLDPLRVAPATEICVDIASLSWIARSC